jgi:sortase A
MKRWMGYLVGGALVLAGAAAAIYPQTTEWRYSFEQAAFASEAGQASSEATSATAGQPMPAGTVARISIAKIGVDAFVVEGTGSAQLDRGPGHYPGTPLPGEQGNACLAGHRTMNGHVFRRLDELVAGDEIVTTTETRQAVYRVVAVRVVGDSDWSITEQTDGYTLTLSTCHPVGSAKQRLVVVAEMVR